MIRKGPHKVVLLGLSIVVVVIAVGLLFAVYDSARSQLLDNRLKSGEREVREIGKLLELQLNAGLSKEQVIDHLQQSILNTDVGVEFICMYTTDGVELCHPNPALVGHTIDLNDSFLSALNQENGAAFLEVLQDGELKSGIRSFNKDKQRGSEIVNVYPVTGTNWMVASHVNIDALQVQLSSLYYNFLIVFLLGVFLIIALSYVLIRVIYNKYELLVKDEINELNEEVTLLNALNQQLLSSQQRLQIQDSTEQAESNAKKRIVTYHKDQVLSVSTDRIAYVFLKNGLSFLRTFSNESYVVNGSLDDLEKQLDGDHFYRVNRQMIININAVRTIYIYGKNQLKLIMDPVFDRDVLISKNKVAAFKKWLDR